MRKNFMKKVVAGMLTAVMAFSLTACGGGDASTNDTAKEEGSSDVITVGFSQVGAESDWRTANSESMKSTFTKDNGYELIFDDAQQKQENQISAIRNFIQQDVDTSYLHRLLRPDGMPFLVRQNRQESRLSLLTVW
jgi:ABC-type sugar transport system substrate-binding protein